MTAFAALAVDSDESSDEPNSISPSRSRSTAPLAACAIVAVVALLGWPGGQRARDWVSSAPASPPVPLGRPDLIWLPRFASNHSLLAVAAAAQPYFDAGMLHMAGFNREEARRAFEAAVAAAPRCAMCHWGVAYACGPTAGEPSSADAATARREAALAHSLVGSPRGSLEAALIAAMALRHPPVSWSVDLASEEAGFRAYAGALDAARKERWVGGGGLSVAERAELDVHYAEALLCLAGGESSTIGVAYSSRFHANNTMEAAGAPTSAVAEATPLLRRALAASPHHPLALHLYIHIAEGRPRADSANGPAAVAEAAEALARVSGGLGHLIHMPSHVFSRLGRFAESVAANERALREDALYRAHGASPYLTEHNLEMLVHAAAMSGRQNTAGLHAAALGRTAFLTTLVRFGEHAKVRATVAAVPCRADPVCLYAHGLALAAEASGGKAPWQLSGGARGEAALATARASLRQLDNSSCDCIHAPTGKPGPPPCAWDNAARCIAGWTLRARIALLDGDVDGAVGLLQRAVEREAGLAYDEPPPWHYPTRHCLGAVLLLAAHRVRGHPQSLRVEGAAPRAEAVFRADLEVWPENPWSLAGVAAAMQARGARLEEVEAVQGRARASWGGDPAAGDADAFDSPCDVEAVLSGSPGGGCPSPPPQGSRTLGLAWSPCPAFWGG